MVLSIRLESILKENKRNKISLRAFIFKVAILVAVMFLIFIYSANEADNNTYRLNKVSFLYEGNQMVGLNTDDYANQLVEVQDEAAKTVLKENKDAAVSTTVISTPSIVDFDISEETQQDTINFAKQNTKILEEGYTINIDNKYKYYVQDMDTINWVQRKILLAYMPDQSYLDYYETTGKFKPYTIGNKTYTNISIDNDIKVTEGYQPGSKFIDDKEQLLFDLFHKDQNKEIAYITEGSSIKSIQDDNKMSDITFKLDNPELTTNAITYNGQEIVTNELNPVLNVVQTYETTETEKVEFDTVQKIDDSMLKGQFEVTTEGQNGEKEITYENQVINGQLVSTEESTEKVIKKPVHRVVSMGEGTVTNSVTVSGSSGGLTDATVTSSGFIWPSASTSVTCEYGGYSGHTGIDIQDYYGAPEYAAKDGIVVTSGWSNYGYGYHVVIDHGNGVKTLYGHQNQQPPVEVGQYVEQGQVIGFEGATGNVTGEHLHFEVQINGTAVNPRPYITSEPAYNNGSVCS